MASKSIDYIAMTSKYATNVNAEAVGAIVKYCGISLRSRDARYVAASDKTETGRIIKGFCAKKLGLDAETASVAVAAAGLQMKASRMKHRVQFYYLVAEHADKLTELSTSSNTARSSSLHAKNAVAFPNKMANSDSATTTSSSVSEGTVVAQAVSMPIQPSTTQVLADVEPTAVLCATPLQPQHLPIAQRTPQVIQANPVVAEEESHDDDLETATPGFFSRIRAWFSSENVGGQYRPH
jgi:Protein of unknown function (DUF2853)